MTTPDAALQILEQALAERRGIEAALRTTEARLRDALESISDGFVLWDAEDRLVLCNQRYLELYPELADHVRPGVAFADLAWQLAHRGVIAEASGRAEAWVTERLRERLRERRERRFQRVVRRLADGRWVRIAGHRTTDGGIVSIHTDITEVKQRETELREREAQLQALVDNVPGVVYRRVLHPDGRIAFPYHGRRSEARYGFGGEAIAKDAALLIEAIHPDDRAGWLAAVKDSAANLTPFEIDCRFRSASGDLCWLRSLATPRRSDDGTVVWDGISFDITELKTTERALRESEERYRGLIEAAPIALLTHHDGRITFVNAKALELFGAADPSELLGRGIISLVHPDDRPVAEARAERLTLSGGLLEPRELRILRPDGTVVEVEASAVAITEQGMPAIQVVLVDITARKRAEERIRHLAHHDALTALPNRALFLDRLHQALALARRDGSRIAVVMLDLDRFKDVNDTLGHPMGDRLLCAVAERLGAIIRESDTLARFGGDEFALVQTGLQEPAGAAVLAVKIIAALSEPLSLDGHEVHTSTSVGIAVFPEDGSEPEALLKHADMALYRAKAQGRGRYEFYVEELQARVHARKVLEEDLRHALERGELALLYQPQVDLRTRAMVGVEALLRWRHPSRGPMAPAAFLKVAESSGLIGPIGTWCLREACGQAMRWRDGGSPVRVGVNISAMQARQPQFVTWVEQSLAATRLPARLLELEITEMVLGEAHSGDCMSHLARLSAKGVRITIDDFGTGCSSLGSLKRMPVDNIKIDTSFVAGIGRDREDEAIVKAILALGHSLGKQVVAEGIETAEQLGFLRDLGCDYGQGHLLGGCLEAAEIGRMMAERAPAGPARAATCAVDASSSRSLG